MSVKTPTITIQASDALLQVLHAADNALKASRSKNKPTEPQQAALHALIVKVAQARMNVTPILSGPDHA